MKLTIFLSLSFFCCVPYALSMEYKKETLAFSVESLQNHITGLSDTLLGDSEGVILIKQFLEELSTYLFTGCEKLELLKQALQKAKNIQAFAVQPDYKEQKCKNFLYGEKELTLEQFSNLALSGLIEDIEKAIQLQGPLGLQNFDKETTVGNRCFMNAALQCLYPLTDLTQALLKNHKLYKVDSISESYLNFLGQLSKMQSLSINPLEFCIEGWTAMGQPISSQQDAAEFIQFLLSHLIKEDMQSSKGENKDVSFLFAFSLVTHLLDQKPGREFQEPHIRSETILNLTLSSKHKTLKDCLDSYFDLEEVASGNGIGQKITQLHTSGKYLIIALNRKMYSGLVKSYYKLGYPISFRIDNFDALGIYSDQTHAIPVYQLVGCVIHSGDPLSGHYTAYVRYGEQWYFCNDLTIKPISTKEMEEIAKQGYGSDKSQTPVMFFYKAQEE
jgi:ubiquitin C-terminal hydrolase